MYAAGRALQFLGILVTGVAFFRGAVGGDVRQELVLLAVGAGVFFAGRFLQGGRK